MPPGDEPPPLYALCRAWVRNDPSIPLISHQQPQPAATVRVHRQGFVPCAAPRRSSRVGCMARSMDAACVQACGVRLRGAWERSKGMCTCTDRPLTVAPHACMCVCRPTAACCCCRGRLWTWSPPQPRSTPLTTLMFDRQRQAVACLHVADSACTHAGTCNVHVLHACFIRACFVCMLRLYASFMLQVVSVGTLSYPISARPSRVQMLQGGMNAWHAVVRAWRGVRRTRCASCGTTGCACASTTRRWGRPRSCATPSASPP